MERRRQEQRRHPSDELPSSRGSEQQRHQRPPASGSPRKLARSREPPSAVEACEGKVSTWGTG